MINSHQTQKYILKVYKDRMENSSSSSNFLCFFDQDESSVCICVRELEVYTCVHELCVCGR